MMSELWTQLLAAFQDLFNDAVLWVPRIGVLLVFVVLAVLLAAIVERLLRAFLVRVRFDDLLRRVGVDKTLRRIGIRRSIDQFVPRLVYFVLLFVFARTAADSLGLTAVSGALGSFLGYLPNVLAALVILMAGSALAEVAGRGVETATAEAGFKHSRALGRLVSGLLLFVLAVMAVAQLRVNTDILRLFVGGLLAGGVLAFGLSFGLGSREITKNILAGLYARNLLRVGDRLEVEGQSGTLVAVTATQLVLQDGVRTHTVANSALLSGTATQVAADG